MKKDEYLWKKKWLACVVVGEAVGVGAWCRIGLSVMGVGVGCWVVGVVGGCWVVVVDGGRFGKIVAGGFWILG
jgi:hypothetical protein